ncbi:MAG TPA: hypothetical protein VFB80_07725 [Pirellulaceae bacterium]|nr:hypothetical protein [Pirellulaceae bacterium]
MIRYIGIALVVAAAIQAPQTAAGQSEAAQGVVEYVQGRPGRTGNLGTTLYAPSEREKPFFKRLAKGEVVTGGLAGDYDITKKDKTYVGWFGIIREIKEDKEKGQTVLLLEHKYFDGLTDLHILALSFNGSGDFQAVVPGVGYKLQPLALVKVYGTVSGPAGDSLPRVTAEFVRHWDWGTFTFLMAAGTQRGSEKWRKANRVDLDRIYEPYPDDRYYEMRLGKR